MEDEKQKAWREGTNLRTVLTHLNQLDGVKVEERVRF
jgi:hypothetical protein